ncbi:2-amino-3,7-dideoxy-D-threo-hept-6-ulosonate synthase [Streptomyces sp. NPDC044571]|uniref:2-amino-3,7-dideoxy-D-threo-hept-6-ulosonate synthase n=1 Tax=Streptomyces sp. NPDC044571 TaxID=3155371 RepID=UPI00340C46A2
MPSHLPFARQLRLRRLYRHGDQRLVVVPLDHSITDGPITGGRRVGQLVRSLAHSGVDATIVHKGTLRCIDPAWFAHMSLIVHLSASTVHAPDPNAKYLVATVEEAVRHGADAVSVHVNIGSDEEKQQIADLARVAEACDRWNMPLLAMMYPRGPRVDNPRDPELILHAASLAADLGADIVKTLYTGSPETMAQVTDTCPLPILVVGGPRRDVLDDTLAYVEETLGAGAAGVAMGRNVFQAPDPGKAARALVDLVHGGPAGLRPIDLGITARELSRPMS